MPNQHLPRTSLTKRYKPRASSWTLTKDLLQIDEVAAKIPAKTSANGSCFEKLIKTDLEQKGIKPIIPIHFIPICRDEFN